MYSSTLRVVPPGYYDLPKLEYTGRVMLPLEAIAQIHNNFDNVPTISVFCITNTRTKQKVYAGMAPSDSRDGDIVMPLWMMDFLGANQGDMVRVQSARPPNGRSATFQPLDSSFNKISDPVTVLSKSLRDFPVLTQGSILPIDFAKRIYKLRVLKTEPSDGILINNVNLNTEFAPPDTDFKHRWLEPDTDSDQFEELKEHHGKTIRGKEITYKDERKVLHPSFADREKERNQPGYVPSVLIFKEGDFVEPEDNSGSKMVEMEKAKYKAQEENIFVGQGRRIGKTKSQSTDKLNSSNDNLRSAGSSNSNLKAAAEEQEEPQKPKTIFYGVGRSINGHKVQGEKAPPKHEKPKEETPVLQSSIFGTGKTLRGRIHEFDKPKEPEADPSALYGKHEENHQDTTFKGKPKTIRN